MSVPDRASSSPSSSSSKSSAPHDAVHEPVVRANPAADPDAHLGAQADFPAPEPDRIASLAYAKYLSRGGEEGHAVEDWLEAEAELRATQPAGR